MNLHFNRLKNIQIFTHEKEDIDPIDFETWAIQNGKAEKNIIGHYLPPETLALIGKNVTKEFLGNAKFGEKNSLKSINHKDIFIDHNRIVKLKSIKHTNYDLIKLIKFTEELNENYLSQNYFCVGMLGRSLLNHVPPIFGYKTFTEVANNYGNKSFKKNMQHMDNSLRSIADGFLHSPIRKKESLPSKSQVNFSQDMDLLLSEIIVILE